MNSTKDSFIEELVTELNADILRAYEESPTIEEAEKLAAKFLSAQIIISRALATADLDARMRKAGMKRVRAAVYTETVSKTEKKPTEVALASIVDMNDLVEGEQTGFDASEVERELLQNYYNICREGHIYFRGVAKGGFNA